MFANAKNVQEFIKNVYDWKKCSLIRKKFTNLEKTSTIQKKCLLNVKMFTNLKKSSWFKKKCSLIKKMFTNLERNVQYLENLVYNFRIFIIHKNCSWIQKHVHDLRECTQISKKKFKNLRKCSQFRKNVREL